MAQHYLYLLKSKLSESLTTYVYRFDDHPFSPANQVLTRLFRQMILAVERSLTSLEVEYIDHRLAQLAGLERAREILLLLGANKDNIIENKKDGVALSRSFTTDLTNEALQYFKWMKDLEELSLYRLRAGQTVKVEVAYVKEMKAWFTPEEEALFLDLIATEGIPIKVMTTT